jgi:hypothetical protein
MNNLVFNRIGVVPAGHMVSGNLMMRNVIRSSAIQTSRDFVRIAVPRNASPVFPEITVIPQTMEMQEISCVMSGLYKHGLSIGIQWHDGIAQHLRNFFTMNNLNVDIAGDFVECCLRPRAADQRGIINVILPSSQLIEPQLYMETASRVNAWETFYGASDGDAITHTLFQFGIQADLFGDNYMAPLQQSGIKADLS